MKKFEKISQSPNFWVPFKISIRRRTMLDHELVNGLVRKFWFLFEILKIVAQSGLTWLTTSGFVSSKCVPRILFGRFWSFFAVFYNEFKPFESFLVVSSVEHYHSWRGCRLKLKKIREDMLLYYSVVAHFLSTLAILREERGWQKD